MPMSASTLKVIRQIHLYIGIFVAPALLFFAFTGALQTFRLHETTQGSSYKPAAWMVTLGQLHKNQTTDAPVRKPRPADDATKAEKPASDAPRHNKAAVSAPGPAPASMPADPLVSKAKTHLAMKLFFLLVAIGLFTSTLSGIAMAYKYNRNKFVVAGLFIAGILIPLLLTRF